MNATHLATLLFIAGQTPATKELLAYGRDIATNVFNSTPLIVVGAVCDFAPIDMHAMGIIGAISQDTFDADPTRASRPTLPCGGGSRPSTWRAPAARW